MLMKRIILPMFFFLSVLGQAAFAQLPDNGNREAAGNWIISETRSPVDYSPQISATILSTPSPGDPQMSFSMFCRQGKTDAVFGIADFARYPAGASFAFDYLIISEEAIRNHLVERRWVQQRGVERRWNELNRSIDVSLVGDTVRFLKSLPDRGIVSVRVIDRQGISHDAEFHLTGLGPVRGKLAAACNWPAP
jgi:hypothetical protein